MTNNASLQQRRVAAVPRGVGNAYAIYAERASNAEIIDVEGRRLIDFAGGIAVLNTGHCHPKVVAAVKDQLEKFTHTCFQVTPYEQYIRLAERLNDLVPGNYPKKTIFLTTGAEAVENAVKIARAHTKRAAVIAFSGAFHGRTLMGMALTGKYQPYKVGFGPFPTDIYHVPFPETGEKDGWQKSMKALETLFKADVGPDNVAAIIIEPVQGEGGFNIVPFEMMKAIRAICDKHGIVFIADEIQTGFCRTGDWFACDHEGVVPDLITTAKGIAGGLPLAAVTGRAELMDAVHAGGLGGTYGGNPIACAAALGAIEEMTSHDLNARARQIETIFRARLTDLATRYPQIGDIRGRGAMMAVELVVPGGKRPDPGLTGAVAKACHARGLVVLTAGSFGNVFRFLPPLSISDELLHEGLDLIDDAFAEVLHD